MLVLGGGAGALAAAFELTATEALRERFEVTVLQPGWRLGGKGASGRRAETGQRIEEHGLHVWFGFYREAFGLIRRAYEELGDDAPAQPWTSAFSPIERLVLWDPDGDELRSWSLPLPAQPLEQVPQTAPDDPALGASERLLRSWRDFLDDVDDGWAAVPAALKLAAAVARASPPDDGRALRETARLLRGAVEAQALIERAIPGDTPFMLRVLNRLLDFWAALLTGIVEDELLRPPGDFDPAAIARLDELEFRAWLKPHVHFEDTLEHSFVRVLYDLAFAYEQGDPKRPNVAAGMALENLFRILFGHDGALMLRMEGGMGDVIFAPLYDALVKRGVHFRFFHHVTGLGVSEDGRAIETVEAIEQATLRDGRVPAAGDGRGRALLARRAALGPARAGRAAACERCRPRARGRSARARLDSGCTAARTSTPSCSASPPVRCEPLCGELVAANPRFAAMLGAGAHRRDAVAADLARRRTAHPPGLGRWRRHRRRPGEAVRHLLRHDPSRRARGAGRQARTCAGWPTSAAPCRTGPRSRRSRRCAPGRSALAHGAYGEGPGSSLVGVDGRAGGALDDQFWRANTRRQRALRADAGRQHQAPAGARRLGLREPRAGRATGRARRSTPAASRRRCSPASRRRPR